MSEPAPSSLRPVRALGAPEDQQVMMEVRNGDVEKLGILFERHHRTLFNLFLRLTGNRNLSEDLVQEAFMRILRFRHTYRAESLFTTWMYRIARNVCTDHFRSRKHEAAWDEETPEPVSQELNAGERLEQRQETVLLREALARLPEEKREVLVLSRYQNLKYEEIAEILSCSVASVKVRVFRAHQDLGEIFFRMSKRKAS